jgi:beta-glucosidase
VPWGFRKILNWAWKRYGLPIYVTENGVSIPNENNFELPEVLNDSFRVRYYKGYLNAMLDAINLDGVQVHGYMAWSLLEYSSLPSRLFPSIPVLVA